MGLFAAWVDGWKEEMWFCESLQECMIESACMFHNTSFPRDEAKALRAIALLAMGRLHWL